MNMMKYKNYMARIEYDEEDRIFVGHLAGLSDIVGFHGSTVDALESAFHQAVDDYVALSEEMGRPAQKPRVSPDIHAAVAVAAEVQGKSINQWAAQALDKEAHVH